MDGASERAGDRFGLAELALAVPIIGGGSGSAWYSPV